MSIQELRIAFETFDEDKSGMLEVDEVIELALSLNAQTTREEFTEMFSGLDTNQDGKISFEEFVSWYRVGRTTQMGAMLQQQIVAERQMGKLYSLMRDVNDNVVEPKEGEAGTEGEGEEEGEGDQKVPQDSSVKLANLVLRDSTLTGIPKTNLKFELRSGDNNSLGESLKYAFPEYDGSLTQFVMVIKASDPVRLRKSLDSFISMTMMSLEEQYPEEVYESTFGCMRIQVGQLNDSVVVLMDPGASIVTLSYQEFFTSMFDYFSQSNLNICSRIQTGTDLNDVLNLVNANKDNLDSEALKENNLLKMLSMGLYFSLTANIQRSYSDYFCYICRSWTSYLFPQTAETLLGIFASYLGDEATIIDTSDDQSKYRQWLDRFLGSASNLPDAVDLYDYMGTFAGVLNSYQKNYPFIGQLVKDLQEQGTSSFEMGMINSDGMALISVEAPGLGNLFESVQSRVQ